MEKTFFKSMKAIVTIITYTIFIIDIGTIINQELSNLETIFFTRYTEGRRAFLCLWNKGYGNSNYDESMDSDIENIISNYSFPIKF